MPGTMNSSDHSVMNTVWRMSSQMMRKNIPKPSSRLPKQASFMRMVLSRNMTKPALRIMLMMFSSRPTKLIPELGRWLLIRYMAESTSPWAT